VLILDEPTSGLDPLQRREVRGLVRELASEHTVLLSSHILAEVEAVCPRVIILNRGRIVADGRRDSLVEGLGGSHVVFEAVVGNAVEARRLLAALPGVEAVEDRGRSGIHHGFWIRGQSDLREDVGALAAQRRWAVRELSWHVPSLEKLFVQLSLGLDEAPEEAAAPAALATGGEMGAGQVEWVGPGAGAAAAPAKAVYNLNPFAAGGQRDLSAPLSVPAATARPSPPTAAESPVAKSSPAAPSPAAPSTPPGYSNLNPFENFGRPKASAAVESPAAAPPPGAPGGPANPQAAPAAAFVSLNPFDRFGQGRQKVHGEQLPQARPNEGAAGDRSAREEPAAAAAPDAGPASKGPVGPASEGAPPPAEPEPPGYRNLNPFENFGRPRGPEPRR
jgi:hypothetical protein